MNHPTSEIQELVEAALAACTADGCVVIGTEHSETNLRFAANSLTTNGQMRGRSLTVVATFDRPEGTSAGVLTRSISTRDELTALVRAAEQAGRVADPAEDASPLVAPYPHDDDWAAAPATTGVGIFEQLAPGLGAAFDRWRRHDQLLFGFAEHQVSSHFLATSTGLKRRFDQPSGRLELNGKSADLARSAWSGLHTCDFRDVDVTDLTDALTQRLDWAATRIELPAGRYETLLPPTAVADLLIYAYWTAGARDADEGRSVFARTGGGTRIGEQLADLPLTLRSDPNEPNLQCPPFEIARASYGGIQSVFDNGAPAGAVNWLDGGRLTNLIRTRAWARATDTAPRPYVDNLILDGTGPTLDDMIARTERGLLLTCLWYIREVDPQTLLLTGLTRDGVYLVENGRITGAVNNFRFNESPIDLLRRLTEVGRTEHTLPREWSDDFPRAAMPALRIPDFNMSTASAAS